MTTTQRTATAARKVLITAAAAATALTAFGLMAGVGAASAAPLDTPVISSGLLGSNSLGSLTSTVDSVAKGATQTVDGVTHDVSTSVNDTVKSVGTVAGSTSVSAVVASTGAAASTAVKDVSTTVGHATSTVSTSVPSTQVAVTLPPVSVKVGVGTSTTTSVAVGTGTGTSGGSGTGTGGGGTTGGSTTGHHAPVVLVVRPPRSSGSVTDTSMPMPATGGSASSSPVTSWPKAAGSVATLTPTGLAATQNQEAAAAVGSIAAALGLAGAALLFGNDAAKAARFDQLGQTLSSGFNAIVSSPFVMTAIDIAQIVVASLMVLGLVYSIVLWKLKHRVQIAI